MTFATSLKTVSAFALALGLAMPAAAQIELAGANRGFELGNDSGYDVIVDAPLETFAVISDGTAKSGTYFARIDNQAQGQAALLKLANIGIGTVTPGQDITVSFWARGSAAAGGVHFAELFSEVIPGGTSKSEILGNAPLFPNSPTEWQFYSFDTTLGPIVDNGVTVQFNAATGANVGSTSTLDIDDISVTVIPEPASLALMGLGGLALVARRRRQA